MVCVPGGRDNSRALARVDFTCYGVSCAKDWVSVDCGTRVFEVFLSHHLFCMLYLYMHKSLIPFHPLFKEIQFIPIENI